MGEDFSCIDPADGDIKLCVTNGETQRKFRVSSKVMRLASPVWRVMLDPQGHFLESSQADDREITFHDDNARAWDILLSIIHLKFSDVPNNITYNELLDVSYLCDKYCMIGIVRPWLEGWLGPLKQTVGCLGYEGWLFISWAIGDEEIIWRVADELTTNWTTNKHRQCLSTANEPVKDNMPPGIIGQCFQTVQSTKQTLSHGDYTEEIMSIRLKAIADLLAICQRLVNRFSAEDKCICRRKRNRRECDVIVFGSLIKGLQALGMWPHSFEVVVDHGSCGFQSQMEKSVNDLVKGIPSAVLPYHVKHMEE